MFSPLFRTGCCCLRFSMHCPFRRCILVVTSFSSLFSSVPRRGCPALFLHFPSISRCGCSVFFFILLFYFPYLTLFSRLFTSFFAPVVAAFAFRCITPSYRLSGAFSSFSFYSPLRLFRVFFILLFYFPYPALFFRFFSLFSAPVVFVLFSCSGQKMKTCER